MRASGGIVGRLLAAVSAAGLAVGAFVLGIAGPAAAADPAVCAASGFASGGREIFTPDRRFVPPPLRETSPDCFSRISGQAWTDDFAYSALFVDTDFATAQRVLAAFAEAGWLSSGGTLDDVLVNVDPGDGTIVAIPISEALALPGADSLRYRAGDPGRSDALVEITYADGTEYVLDGSLPGALLEVDVFGVAPWPAAGLDDPSVLSTLRTIAEALPTPAQTGVIAGSAVVLTLVLGWPSTLLNSVIGSRYQAIVRWVTTRLRRGGARENGDREAAQERDTAAPTSRPVRGSRLPGWLMWPGFAAAAIIGAFVDPDFGWNPMSLRVVLTLFCSFVLFNLAAWAVVRAVARRLQPESRPYLRFRWGSLLVVALAVFVARLLELEPGVIFGLVAGIAYAATLTAARSAIITIVGSAFALVLAAIGWIGYSLLAPLETNQFAILFLVEFLAGMTIKGVSSLPLALLPFSGLDGGRLFGWRRVVWGASYAVGLGAFMLVLLTIPNSWTTIPGDFLRWLLLFGGYAVLAIVAWIVNAVALKRRPPPPEAEQGEQPDAITLD